MELRPDQATRLGAYWAERGWVIDWTVAKTGPDAKRCRNSWNQTQPFVLEDETGVALAEKLKRHNPVVVAAGSDLFLVDCDGPEDIAAFSLCDPPETLQVRSSPGKMHYYYRQPEETLPHSAALFEGGSIKVKTNQYLVTSPARHPSGSAYEFLDRDAPIAEMTREVYDRILAAKARNDAGVAPDAPWGEGERYENLFRQACSLRGRDDHVSEDDALAEIRALNLARCNPPHDDAKIVALVKDVYGRYPAGGQEALKAAADDARSDTAAGGQKTATPPYIDFRDIVSTPETWLLDQGRLLEGELNVLAGIGGMGKTTTYINWVAELSQQGVKTLVLVERKLDSWKRRAIAAEVDFEHVRTFDSKVFRDIHNDVGMIAAAVADGYSFLVLDPINHWLPNGINTYATDEMTQKTRGLSDLMASGALTTLVVHHLNKSDKSEAINRLTGSTWFRDAAANVLGIGETDDPERRAVVCIKTNADEGVLRGALIYQRTIVEIEEGGFTTAVARSILVDTDDSASRDSIFDTNGGSGSGGHGNGNSGDSATEKASEALRYHDWVPHTADDAKGEGWFEQNLREKLPGLSERAAYRVLQAAIDQGDLHVLPAKSGPNGYKARYWRQDIF